jgi:NAD-dependent dihydropyrimidine dehydrogenase PreA subunit
MIDIDSIKCTGCGNCVDVCPQQAITIDNDIAVVNQELCVQCGACLEICPAGAIRQVAPVYAEAGKGGERMLYGYGRGFGGGFGRGGGWGFGFRGASPPWPYVGLGRGGLPRCGYFFSGVGASAPWSYQPPSFRTGMPATLGYAPYPTQVTKEQEMDFLREEANAVKRQLKDIEARIKELEAK